VFDINLSGYRKSVKGWEGEMQAGIIVAGKRETYNLQYKVVVA